eukprot:236682_1
MSFASSTVSNSKSNLSEWTSINIAKSMVWSDSGLSLFDYELDRRNADTVCTLLHDLQFKIVAVWIVGRPLNGYKKTSYEHWSIKIQAPPALLSMDWLESKKKGAFGLQQTVATDAELEDFLHYFVRKQDGSKIKKKWRIISSVTPSPLKNTSYLKYIDDHDIQKLKAFMKKNNNKRNVTDLVQHIDIKKNVADIADFISMWTETLTKTGQKRAVTYNAITRNCQQFAVDLFDFLVGYKYSEKVQYARVRVQSPFDKQKYNIQENINDEKNKNDHKSDKYINHNWHDFTENYIVNELQSYFDNEKMEQKYDVEEDKEEEEEIDENKDISIELIEDILVTEQADIQIVKLKSKNLNSEEVRNQSRSALYCSIILCGYYLYLIPVSIYDYWKEFSMRTKIDDIIIEYEHKLDKNDDGNFILNEECAQKMIENLYGIQETIIDNDITVAVSMISGHTKLELQQSILSVKNKKTAKYDLLQDVLSEIFELKFIPSWKDKHSHTKQKMRERSIEQTERIDVRNYSKVIPFNLAENKYAYGLAFYSNTKDILLLKFSSNNIRFAMVTHLDYTINCLCQQTSDILSNVNDNKFHLSEEKKDERYRECSDDYCWYSSKLIKYMRIYEQNGTIFRASTHADVLQCYQHCRIKHPNPPTKECEIMHDNQCICYSRNYRDRNAEKRQETDLYDRAKLQDERDVARMQIFDSIHCYLFHTSQVNDKNNIKFMNDFENYENDAKANQGFQLNFHLPNPFASSAVSESCGFNADNLIDHENIILNHDYKNAEKVVNKFGFGEQLSYWNNWDDNKKSDVMVNPKYETLKTELTKNKLYKLTDEQYYETYNKAQFWNKAVMVKAKNIGNKNKLLNIKPGEQWTVNHIIALMVYCNFTYLQFKFKQHCRPYDNESMESFRERNSEIGHWSRYLMECGLIYGDKMNATDTLYTGLTCKLLFNSLNANFYCPLSTTPQLIVAQKFCKTNNGMIIKLQRANETTMNFNVSYLSDFPTEDERLIVGQSLTIMNILLLENLDNDKNVSLTQWILALHLFEKIVSGLFFVFDKELMNKQVQKNLLLLIEQHIMPNEEQKPVHYIQQIFDNMSKRKLTETSNEQKREETKNGSGPWFNLCELKSLYRNNKKLASHFYDTKKQILGPLLLKYKYKNKNRLQWVQQFNWKIDGNTFSELKNSTNKWIYSQELYTLHIAENSRFTFNFGMKQSELCIFIKSINAESIKQILIEYDRLCSECNYHSYMYSEWITLNVNSKDRNIAGGKTFDFNLIKLNKLAFISWNIAIKIIDVIFE